MQSALDLLSAAAFAQFELAADPQLDPEQPQGPVDEPEKDIHLVEEPAREVDEQGDDRNAVPTTVADEDALALLGAFASSLPPLPLPEEAPTPIHVEESVVEEPTALPLAPEPEPEPEPEPVPVIPEPLQSTEDAQEIPAPPEPEVEPEPKVEPEPIVEQMPLQEAVEEEEEQRNDQEQEDDDRTDSDGAPPPQVAGVKRPRDASDEGDIREPALQLPPTFEPPTFGSAALPPLPTSAPLTLHLTFNAIALPPLPTSLPLIPASLLPPLPLSNPLPPEPTPEPTRRLQRPASIPHLVPEDAGVIRCVCPYTSDDGFTIQCDFCNVWQHAHCVAISPEAVPDEYLCELCDPVAAKRRGVDARKAEEAQRQRMELELRRDPAEDQAMRRTTSIGLGATRPKQKRVGSGPSAGAAGAAADDGSHPPLTPGSTSQAQTQGVAQSTNDSATKRRRGVGATTTASRQASTNSRSRGTSLNVVATTSTSSTTTAAAAAVSISAVTLTEGATSRGISDDEDDDRYETWQYEFTPVDSNLWPDRELVSRLTSLIQEPCPPSTIPTETDLPTIPVIFESLPPPAAVAVQPVAPGTFHLVPPLAHSYAPTNSQSQSCPYPRPTIHALFSVSAIPVGTYIAPVKGRVISLASYRADPLNQYSILGVPKQGVRVLPMPWSIAIDQRQFGNEVRFARSGCHPNAVVRVVQLAPPAGEIKDGGEAPAKEWIEQRRADSLSNLSFALFATADISKREEIVVPWDWDDSHIVHALPALMAAPPLPSFIAPPDLEPLSRKMAAVTTTLLGTTHCACEKKRDCALFWMCRAASAAAPLSRTQLVKREPFATILMNALGGGKEEGAAKGKARKVKKPDVGPLLGIERRWVPKPEPPPPNEEEEEKENTVIEPETMEVDDKVLIADDQPAVNVDVAPLPVLVNDSSTAPSVVASKAPSVVEDMDVDESTEASSSAKRRKSISTSSRRTSISRPAAAAKATDGNETDDSDLTEPLSHSSDHEGDRKNKIPVPTRSSKGDDGDDDEDEQIVRPPVRKRLIGGVKRTSKDVGPSRKRAREREAAEKEKEKLRRFKALERGKSRATESDSGAEKPRPREKDSPKATKVVERERKKKVVVVKKVAVTERPTDAGHKRPVGSVPFKIAVPAPSRQSRSPTPTPVSAPVVPPPPVPAASTSSAAADALAAELFAGPAEVLPPPPAISTEPPTPPPPPPRRMTLQDYKLKRQSLAAGGDASATTTSTPPTSDVVMEDVNASAEVPPPAVAEPEPEVKAVEEGVAPPPEPEPEPEPEPPRPAPRARLSLAAYRQRQQAQKEAEPVPEVAAPAAAVPSPSDETELNVTKVSDPASSGPTSVASISRAASPLPSTEPIAASPASVPSTASTFNSNSAEDVLKRLGDYFSKQQPAALPPPPVVAPRPVGPMSYTRPVRQSSTPPRYASPEPASASPRVGSSYGEVRSPVYQPTFDFPSRAARFSPPPAPVGPRASYPPAGSRPNTLGLALDGEAPRDAASSSSRAVPPPLSRYEYGSAEPVSPALHPAKLYSPPPRGSPSVPSVSLHHPDAMPPRPSPPVRPFDRLADVPTGPRGHASPTLSARGSFPGPARGGFGARPLPSEPVPPSAYGSGANASFPAPGAAAGPSGAGRGRGFGPAAPPAGATPVRQSWPAAGAAPTLFRGSPALRARYDGIPRGPAAMRGGGRGVAPGWGNRGVPRGGRGRGGPPSRE